MIERVISGGQTGADQAGWRAAKAAGISTGGWMPKGYLTEAGPRPEFVELYGARELASDNFADRTRQNASETSATLWFGSLDSPGARATERACLDWGRTMYCVIEGTTRPSDVARWIRTYGHRSLNVAGNRESKNPGLGERAERFLAAVFRMLAGTA